MLFRIVIFFVRRLLFPAFFGIVSCVLLAILFTVFSEKLYDFIPIATMIMFCIGSFVSSKICTRGIKRSSLLLSSLCSLVFSLISSSISIFIFHGFSFSNFLIKLSLAIIFGLLGTLKRKNKNYSINKGRTVNH